MKKICLLLCFLILLCSFEFAVFANDFDFLKTAEMVKQKVDIPENYTGFSGYVDIGSSVNTILSWSGGDSNDGGVVTVVTDSLDRIIALSQYKYGKYEGNFKLSSIDYNKACEIAEGYAKRIIPEFASKLVLVERPNHILRNNENYSVLFYRYENGLPCYDNYVIFLIDAYTKDVSEYRAVWDDCKKISPVGKYISKKDALVAFDEKIGIELSYSNADGKIKLVYSTRSDGTRFVSAYNGNIISTNQSGSADNYIKKTDFEKQLIPTGMDYDLPSLVTEKIKNADFFSIADDYTITDSKLYIDEVENVYAKITYTSLIKQPVSVVLDTKTYDIVSYNAPRAKSDNSQMLSDSACFEKATMFAKAYMNSYYRECKGAEEILTQDKNIYRVKFKRYVNGIPYSDNGIIVDIDRADGCVINAKARIDQDVEFPLSIADVSVTEAYDIFVNEIGFGLQYVPVNGADGKELIAVYGFNPTYPVYVCGTTGKPCDVDGNVYQKPQEKIYTDIAMANSYNQIKTLSLAHIMNYEGDKFAPEVPVAKSEFAIVINNVFNTAYTGGEEYITHEEAVGILIGALGYKDIASLDDTYSDVFVDCGFIAPQYHGSAVLAKGLGIVNGNAFLPNEYVTRAYLAELIYNTITERDEANEN